MSFLCLSRWNIR